MKRYLQVICQRNQENLWRKYLICTLMVCLDETIQDVDSFIWRI